MAQGITFEATGLPQVDHHQTRWNSTVPRHNMPALAVSRVKRFSFSESCQQTAFHAQTRELVEAV